MLRASEFLYLYRIRTWGNKLSALRSIGYIFLGYLIAGKFNLLQLTFNSLAVFAALIFCFSINNYFDWKIQKEDNFLSRKFKEKKVTKEQAWIYYFIIFLPIFLVFLNGSKNSILIFWMGFLLILFYSLPKIRLKEKKVLGFITPPVAAVALFLQGYFVLGIFHRDVIFLSVIIFLFQCYLESLHAIKDSFDPKEVKKVSMRQNIRLMKIFPIISLFCSSVFSFFNIVFLINIPFSLLRLTEAKSIRLEKIQAVRSNLFSPLLSLYEFLIYGVLGLFDLFLL